MLRRKNIIVCFILLMVALAVVSPILSKPDKPDHPGNGGQVDQGQGNGNGNGNSNGNGNGQGNGNGGQGQGQPAPEQPQQPAPEQGQAQDPAPVSTIPPETVQATSGGLLGCQKNNPERLDCSSLSVSSICQDGVAIFTIRNTGEAGNGDMRAATSYRLIVNGVVVESGSVQLGGGATMTIQWAGGGHVRLEADQQVGHPGNSHPNASSNCSGSATTPTTPPTVDPTTEPTLPPTVEPTLVPTFTPTDEPTVQPTPTDEPTVEPTPTDDPTPLPPHLTAHAYCEIDGSIVFVVSNDGGDMPDAAYYSVTDNDGNLVGAGWIQLASNGSQSLQYWNYTTLTLTIGDYQLTVYADCQPGTPTPDVPVLQASAYCMDDGSITFYVDNFGIAMPEPVTYYVFDFDGNRIGEGTVQLGAGAYTSISIYGYTGATLIVGDFQATAYADCSWVTPTPSPTPTEDPTVEPTPTDEPTVEPTITPTQNPTVEPTNEPTIEPTSTPTENPTTTPTPTHVPTTTAPLSCTKNNTGRLDCSSLQVSGTCVDGVAVFTIRNTGERGNGDMRAATEYRLVVDGVVVESGSVQLLGNATLTVTYSGGGTVTLQADQQIGHPGNSRPNATVSCS